MKDKMEILTLYVPEKYKDELQKIADEHNMTVSAAYRHIYGLDYEEFNFVFSIKEKMLLRYVQILAVLTYGFSDWLSTKAGFYMKKGNNKKQKFYEFIYRRTNSLYSYFNEILLPLCDEGFETLSDDILNKEAENIEAVVYLIENGTPDDWEKVRALAHKYHTKHSKKGVSK